MSAYHFADFELDPSRFELRRNGRALKLERIPMELLILLLEKQGDVATRQEIVDRLWGKDVFVDTEHGINTAIRKIRQTLRDDPEKPKFLQTVTGKGYRFVGAKNGNSVLLGPAEAQVNQVQRLRSSGSPETPSPETEPASGAQANKNSWRVAAALVILLAVVAVALIALRTRLFPARQAPKIRSIAVLPLANLSGDKSQDYFADGMTDELITALAKNRNLRVVSRTSAMQYKGVSRPVKEIARELNVDGILEGSIERGTNSVHMTVQLIYAPTDTHIWAESYDRDFPHAISIPTELSQTIAEQIKLATSPSKPAPAINPEAHDAYLRGRYFWLNFDTKQSLNFFQRAIDIQPDYAAAWSGLADSYSFAAVLGDPRPDEVMAKARAAARKAIDFDASLPESHCSMAGTAFLSWDLALADTEIRRALDIDPNYAESHYLHYHILNVENHRDEALEEARRYTQLDPFSRPWGLGAAYTNVRQWDAALDEFHLQAQARPTDATMHFYLSRIYWFKGMHKESEEELEKAFQLSGNSKEAAAIHNAFEHGGGMAVERQIAEEVKAQARKAYISPMDIAEQVSYTGNKEETLKYLEDAYRQHIPNLIWIQAEPFYDFLHSDPRFQAIVKKMGLPLAQ